MNIYYTKKLKNHDSLLYYDHPMLHMMFQGSQSPIDRHGSYPFLQTITIFHWYCIVDISCLSAIPHWNTDMCGHSSTGNDEPRS